MNGTVSLTMPTVLPRHLAVVVVVLTAHAGLLWLMNAGLESRPMPEPTATADLVMTVQWLGPSAQPVASPPPPPAVVASATLAAARSAVPPQPSASRPLAPAPTAAAEASVATANPSVDSLASREAPVPDAGETTLATNPSASAGGSTAPSADGAHSSAGSIASGAPPTPQIEWPSAAASYLNNPPPAYPPLSRRLGEQGKVVVRARIEVNGTASQAEIRTSSGYSRLDQTAIDTVLRWRYVPGTRNGTPEAMWFHIPIHFVLE